LAATAGNQSVTDEPLLNAALEAFEPHFFNKRADAPKAARPLNANVRQQQ
jgi:hypothetical protein